LVVDTNDDYSVVGDGVDEILTADFHWVDGICNGREERRKQRECAGEL
jgi:hypothetical protein